MLTKKPTIFDSGVQDHFEDWVIEAGVKIRFNTATYFMETKKRNKVYSLLQKIGFNIKSEINIMHVVTNRPGYLIGKAGIIINKYEKLLSGFGIDKVTIHEITSQDALLRGIKRKISTNELAEHNTSMSIGNNTIRDAFAKANCNYDERSIRNF